MFFYLALLFIVLPIVELAILIRIGTATVWWVPVAIVIFTGVTGAALARWQGWRVLERIRGDIRDGRMPADAIIDGFLILLAGILLVTPGVLTDLVGIAFLIPPIRSLFKRGVKAWIKTNVEFHVGRVNAGVWTSAGNAPPPEHDQIIDAKVLKTNVEDAKKPRR